MMRERIIQELEKMDAEHSNDSAIFFGAIYDYQYIQNHEYEKFSEKLLYVIRDAIFYRWHDTPANAAKTYCHLCGIDPALIEVFLGKRLDDLANEYIAFANS